MQSVFNKIEKYNTWSGQNLNTGFERISYLNKISKYLDNNLVKVLVGQRRVGKSYILRQIMNLLINKKRVNPKNIFYVNKEYTAFDELITRTTSTLDRLKQRAEEAKGILERAEKKKLDEKTMFAETLAPKLEQVSGMDLSTAWLI